MSDPAASVFPLWPLAAFFMAVVVLVGLILVLSYVLGERHQERTTGQPYESGVLPVGPARRRVPVKYYLVAVAFVVFDLESIYIFAWVAAFRELGWAGYLEIVIFIGVLLATLVYFWRVGALDWSPQAWRPGDEMKSAVPRLEAKSQLESVTQSEPADQAEGERQSNT